jgi:hypothetical protein
LKAVLKDEQWVLNWDVHWVWKRDEQLDVRKVLL